MIDDSVAVRNEHLVFEGTDDSVLDAVERRLRRRYGRGLFVHNHGETADGTVLLHLGVAYPRDVSDSRDGDRVMKFVNVGEVTTLRANPTGQGYYSVRLPDREEFTGEFEQRRAELLDRLNWSTARAIFEQVYRLQPVRNQLNSIVRIVRFLRRESSITVDRLDDIQGEANTEAYLGVLSDFDFVRLDDGVVYPGEKMEAVDAVGLDRDTYERQIVGQIIADAYHVLREELDLRMLSHFPKYANAYYFTALQRDDPGLRLDTDAVRQNLATEWGDDVDPLVVREKLDALTDVEVLRRDGEFVTGDAAVYDEITAGSDAVPLAD